jgi:hypothetical protein
MIKKSLKKFGRLPANWVGPPYPRKERELGIPADHSTEPIKLADAEPDGAARVFLRGARALPSIHFAEGSPRLGRNFSGPFQTRLIMCLHVM